MSSTVVISVEGVLAEHGIGLPMAQPIQTGVYLVQALARQWTNIAFVTVADPAVATEWLSAYGVPQWQWIVQVTPEDRAEAILANLARRSDRCALYLDNTPVAFALLLQNHVPVLLFNAQRWELGDWRPKTSWINDAEDGVE